MAKKRFGDVEDFEISEWNIAKGLGQMRVERLKYISNAFLNEDPKDCFLGLQVLFDFDCLPRFPKHLCIELERELVEIEEVIENGGVNIKRDVIFKKKVLNRLRKVAQRINGQMFRQGMLEPRREKIEKFSDLEVE